MKDKYSFIFGFLATCFLNLLSSMLYNSIKTCRGVLIWFATLYNNSKSSSLDIFASNTLEALGFKVIPLFIKKTSLIFSSYNFDNVSFEVLGLCAKFILICISFSKDSFSNISWGVFGLEAIAALICDTLSKVSDKIDKILKDCGTFYTGIGEINIDVDEIKLITEGLNNGKKIEDLLKEIDNPIEMKENDFGIDR